MSLKPYLLKNNNNVTLLSLVIIERIFLKLIKS